MDTSTKAAAWMHDARVWSMTMMYLAIVMARTVSIGTTLEACAYRSADPPAQLQTVYTQIHDTARNKTIPLKIYAPNMGGPYPVIIFSHGAGGCLETASMLTPYWARQGYVVIHPSHLPDMDPLNTFSVIRFVYELNTLITQGPLYWRERTSDIRWIIDHLPGIEASASGLTSKFNPASIGVGGHSMGAYTALLIGGMQLYDRTRGDTAFGYKDNRVNAVVAISAPGANDGQGTTDRSWDYLGAPTFIITGSLDPGAGGEPPIWRTDAFHKGPMHMNPVDKYCLFIDGATHLSFVGLDEQDSQIIAGQLTSQPLTEQMGRLLAPSTNQGAVLEYTAICGHAFWDAYLKHMDTGKTYLDMGLIEWYSISAADLDRN